MNKVFFKDKEALRALGMTVGWLEVETFLTSEINRLRALALATQPFGNENIAKIIESKAVAKAYEDLLKTIKIKSRSEE